MAISMSLAELRRARLRSQALAPGSLSESTGEIVRDLFALQAQEWSAAQLAIHARSNDLVQADVIHAREVKRAFVWEWLILWTGKLRQATQKISAPSVSPIK